jgi:hypothetical protein
MNMFLQARTALSTFGERSSQHERLDIWGVDFTLACVTNRDTTDFDHIRSLRGHTSGESGH